MDAFALKLGHVSEQRVDVAICQVKTLVGATVGGRVDSLSEWSLANLLSLVRLIGSHLLVATEAWSPELGCLVLSVLGLRVRGAQLVHEELLLEDLCPRVLDLDDWVVLNGRLGVRLNN